MGEYKNISIMLEAKREEAAKVEESKKAEEEKKIQNECDARAKLKEGRIRHAEKRAAFSENCLNDMLTSTLTAVVTVSMTQPTEEEIRKVARLCENYVTTEGAKNIISRTRNNSLWLAEMYGIIEKYHERMLREADEDQEDKDDEEDDFTVDPRTEEEFYDELDEMDDTDDVTNAIRIRVTNAEEKFLTDNIENKMDTEDTIKQTAERLAAIDASRTDETSDEEVEAMKQEATMMGRKKMDDIAFNKRRSVFEQVVRNVATSVVSNPALLEAYSDKSELNMDAIVSTAKCIYTFNEALIVAKLERPSEEFVKNMLESI